MEMVGNWVKHLQQQDQQLFDSVQQLKDDLSSVKDELVSVREALQEVSRPVEEQQVSARLPVYDQQTAVFDDYKAVQARSYFEAIKEVQVIDKLTVKFILKDDYFGNFEVCATMQLLPIRLSAAVRQQHLHGAGHQLQELLLPRAVVQQQPSPRPC